MVLPFGTDLRTREEVRVVLFHRVLIDVLDVGIVISKGRFISPHVFRRESSPIGDDRAQPKTSEPLKVGTSVYHVLPGCLCVRSCYLDVFRLCFTSLFVFCIAGDSER